VEVLRPVNFCKTVTDTSVDYMAIVTQWEQRAQVPSLNPNLNPKLNPKPEIPSEEVQDCSTEIEQLVRIDPLPSQLKPKAVFFFGGGWGLGRRVRSEGFGM
jgi:hypothetical protein